MKTPPERWTGRIAPEVEKGENDMSAEDRAALFLRRSIVRQPLAASALAGVRDRITPAERAQPGRRWALRVAVGIALFLSGGGVVMSATLIGGWAPFHRTKQPATTRPADVDVPISRRPPRTTAAVVSPTVEAPRPTPPSPIVPVRRVRSAQAIAPTPAPADVAPPPAPEPARPSAIAEESALIGAALRRLRETDDAAGALALLDDHDARFGSTSPLADEAATIRVEALLRIGSLARALALLDKLTPRPAGRGRELLATRGELRAEAARCSEALADFEPLLAAEGKPEGARDLIFERALYGRAACRARLGEHDAARADLETYLARFPAGRFAARARAALDK
jgi:hypothetical protein